MQSSPASGSSIDRKKKPRKAGQRRKKKKAVQSKVILQSISPAFKALAVSVLFFFCLCIVGVIYIPDTTKRDFLLLRGHTGSGPDRATAEDRNNIEWKKFAEVDSSSSSKRKHAAIRAPELPLAQTDLLDMRQLSATLPFDNPAGGAWKQGWDVQPLKPSKTEPVKIFVVPHSHCDPGWIKTFDQYFQSQTKQIVSTIVEALSKDPKRKFIWAEISYFEWWYREQSPEVQELTKKLLASKQLEFVTGGWVQPDEANTQLYAMEVQLQEGHEWIRKTFGEQYIPKYGWSIDPFGYSPTMAYLLKKYDFKAMLIQRVHYAVKKELAKRKHLEFKWRQIWDEDGEYDIFCHVMPFFSYDVPHTCGPDPSVCCQFDFARLGRHGGCPWKIPPQEVTERNVRERSLLLLDQYLKKASLYRSGAVIAPLGDDFRYQSAAEAEKQYTNYQKMFDYINANVDGVEIQFGTLSEYFEAAMSKFDPPLLKGSFFTYSDVNEDYWSGYFTSRVFDKALDRRLERVLYAATSLGASDIEMQNQRRALSLFQHHDGITGTAKNPVVADYANQIYIAIGSTQDWIARKLEELDANRRKLQPCWRSNSPRGLSSNLCLNNDGIKEVKVYNPLETPQMCGSIEVPGHQAVDVPSNVPCGVPGMLHTNPSGIQFDPKTGLMTHPIREDWMVWRVRKGGAYLFFPDQLHNYNENLQLNVEGGGLVVSTEHWKRHIEEKKIDMGGGQTATVIDFVYETNLQERNEEWLVRFTSDNIKNQGIFHTDLNGFDFDTHKFRSDLPLQSQVFPMPTLASIEDEQLRMTILSEHAQGTASTEDGTIDVWLDRRLNQDDSRGLGQGVTDNVPTRTRLRLVLESVEGKSKEDVGKVTDNYAITPVVKRMWDELNHPLELFGASVAAAPG